MNPIEIIYDGYIEDRKSIDTEETIQASDNLLEIIESLLPASEKIQNVVFAECLHLAMLSQKQGFVAGFEFALEVMGIGKADKQ